MALILLMIYMCMMYGFIPGMIANGALFLNFFFVLGVLSSFQAALTMSGIAGMVLSLGMAVDANVLIYERTKEELRAGKGVKKALADGYSNAYRSDPWFCYDIDYRYSSILLHRCVHDPYSLRTLHEQGQTIEPYIHNPCFKKLDDQHTF